MVGYDNHWPKGHHRHVLAEEGPYTYGRIDTLVADFKADIPTIIIPPMTRSINKNEPFITIGCGRV